MLKEKGVRPHGLQPSVSSDSFSGWPDRVRLSSSKGGLSSVFIIFWGFSTLWGTLGAVVRFWLLYPQQQLSKAETAITYIYSEQQLSQAETRSDHIAESKGGEGEVEGEEYRKRKPLTPAWFMPSRRCGRCGWSLWLCVSAKPHFSLPSHRAQVDQAWGLLRSVCRVPWVQVPDSSFPAKVQVLRVQKPEKDVSFPPTRPLDKTSRPWMSNKSVHFGFGRCQRCPLWSEPTSAQPHLAAKPTRDMDIMNSKTEQSPKTVRETWISWVPKPSKARQQRWQNPSENRTAGRAIVAANVQKSNNFGFGRCQRCLPLFKPTSAQPHPAHNRKRMWVIRPPDETLCPWMSTKVTPLAWALPKTSTLFEPTSTQSHLAAKPTRDIYIMYSETEQSPKTLREPWIAWVPKPSKAWKQQGKNPPKNCKSSETPR